MENKIIFNILLHPAVFFFVWKKHYEANYAYSHQPPDRSSFVIQNGPAIHQELTVWEIPVFINKMGGRT